MTVKTITNKYKDKTDTEQNNKKKRNKEKNVRSRNVLHKHNPKAPAPSAQYHHFPCHRHNVCIHVFGAARIFSFQVRHIAGDFSN